MHKLAPVIIFAYRRPAHFARTLSALALNAESAQTDLIIYCDHVPGDASAEAIYQMRLTRDIARRESRFLSVKVIERSSNFGLSENVMQGVSDVIQEHGRVIVLEDDHLVAKSFLKFMNEALLKYEHCDEVACISGYVYPLEHKPDSAFFIRGADCWGWASWKNKWSILERDAGKLIAEIERNDLTNALDYDGSYPYLQMLRDRQSGANNSWAILWYASALLRNELCLYPASSLVQNIGNDGSGTHHLAWINTYNVSFEESAEIRWPGKIEESQEGRNLFKSFFKGMKIPFSTRVRRKVGRLIRKIRNNNLDNFWSGDYTSWQEAQSDCTGYDSDAILKKVQASVRKVVSGEAAFERDGVTFNDFSFSSEILSSLEHVYQKKGDPICVLDFGGSLGSLFFQYRNLLKGKVESWSVVEQKHFVEAGKAEFENAVLKFYFSLEESIAMKRPDVLILSSVLCYLDDPYIWIKKFLDAGVENVIVDRTAFIQGKTDRLTIQKVPQSIYPATYPAWFLNEEKFLMTWLSEYDIAGELPDSIDGVNFIEDVVCYRKGYYFVRRR